jgi:polygalacturonase
VLLLVLVLVLSLAGAAAGAAVCRDGINFSGGADQLLQNCTIANGDDCVSVITYGPGADRSSYSPCQSDPTLCRGGSVVVEDVICDGGHGASIGSVRHGVVENVTFRRMTLKYGPSQSLDSGGGCRIKTYPNGSGTVASITFEDIAIEGVAYPLQILAQYHHHA